MNGKKLATVDHSLWERCLSARGPRRFKLTLASCLLRLDSRGWPSRKFQNTFEMDVQHKLTKVYVRQWY